MIWKLLVMFSCISYEAVYPGKVSKLPRTSRNTRRSEKRSRPLRSRSFAKAFQVESIRDCRFEILKHSFSEEFGIYLNYVRKLGFEETPDYDFLRELFTKVLRSNGDVDDGVFDWNLLNGAISKIHLYVFSKADKFRWKGLGSFCGLYLVSCSKSRLS